jgi:predicted DNA-binding transcriptional regulator YafY
MRTPKRTLLSPRPASPIARPQRTRAKRGRPRGDFTQHRRLDKLRDALEAHPGGVELKDLAAILHVTTRSVRRYLLELARVVKIESLETMPGGANAWRIVPTERVRSINLRRSQAYGLLATRRTFDVLKGSALFDEIDLAMRQVLQIAQRPTRAAQKGEIPSDLRLEERLVSIGSTPRTYAGRGEEIDALFQAVAELRVIAFRYKFPGIDAKSERISAHPYALVEHRGALVCIARDVMANTTKPYAFDRMVDVTASEEARFELPNDFDVSDFAQGDFALGLAAKHRVLVEFDAKIADDVRARKVHPAQKIATSNDGRIRVSLPFVSLDDAKSWVLSFGENARVIEPPELVLAVADALRLAFARYE